MNSLNSVSIEDNKVPSNFNEAKQKFEEMYGHSKWIVGCMIGILECRMKQGEPFLEAYENTLLDYIKNTQSKDLIKEGGKKAES